jgi:hypothetical protein
MDLRHQQRHWLRPAQLLCQHKIGQPPAERLDVGTHGMNVSDNRCSSTRRRFFGLGTRQIVDQFRNRQKIIAPA